MLFMERARYVIRDSRIADSKRFTNREPRTVIGLLGGSFNPAHSGHLHISREALKRLGLREVWWLVSPQNPLKKSEGMADYKTRLKGAREMAAKEKRIWVTDLERRLGTVYTIDTITALKKRHPRASFVWLMGADNLANFHRWRRWREIAKLVPIAVFDRAPWSHAALRSHAALTLAQFRLSGGHLVLKCPPALVYLPIRRDSASATQLRKKLEKSRVSRHTK
jgi:nicotinate-nucleotide adenylyltransferase